MLLGVPPPLPPSLPLPLPVPPAAHTAFSLHPSQSQQSRDQNNYDNSIVNIPLPSFIGKQDTDSVMIICHHSVISSLHHVMSSHVMPSHIMSSHLISFTLTYTFIFMSFRLPPFLLSSSLLQLFQWSFVLIPRYSLSILHSHFLSLFHDFLHFFFSLLFPCDLLHGFHDRFSSHLLPLFCPLPSSLLFTPLLSYFPLFLTPTSSSLLL